MAVSDPPARQCATTAVARPRSRSMHSIASRVLPTPGAAKTVARCGRRPEIVRSNASMISAISRSRPTSWVSNRRTNGAASASTVSINHASSLRSAATACRTARHVRVAERISPGSPPPADASPRRPALLRRAGLRSRPRHSKGRSAPSAQMTAGRRPPSRRGASRRPAPSGRRTQRAGARPRAARRARRAVRARADASRRCRFTTDRRASASSGAPTGVTSATRTVTVRRDSGSGASAAAAAAGSATTGAVYRRTRRRARVRRPAAARAARDPSSARTVRSPARRGGSAGSAGTPRAPRHAGRSDRGRASAGRGGARAAGIGGRAPRAPRPGRHGGRAAGPHRFAPRRM